MTGINPASVSAMVTRSGNASSLTQQIKSETEGLETRKTERKESVEKESQVSAKREEIAENRENEKREESRASHREERNGRGRYVDVFA